MPAKRSCWGSGGMCVFWGRGLGCAGWLAGLGACGHRRREGCWDISTDSTRKGSLAVIEATHSHNLIRRSQPLIPSHTVSISNHSPLPPFSPPQAQSRILTPIIQPGNPLTLHPLNLLIRRPDRPDKIEPIVRILDLPARPAVRRVLLHPDRLGDLGQLPVFPADEHVSRPVVCPSGLCGAVGVVPADRVVDLDDESGREG